MKAKLILHPELPGIKLKKGKKYKVKYYDTVDLRFSSFKRYTLFYKGGQVVVPSICLSFRDGYDAAICLAGESRENYKTSPSK